MENQKPPRPRPIAPTPLRIAPTRPSDDSSSAAASASAEYYVCELLQTARHDQNHSPRDTPAKRNPKTLRRKIPKQKPYPVPDAPPFAIYIRRRIYPPEAANLRIIDLR